MDRLSLFITRARFRISNCELAICPRTVFSALGEEDKNRTERLALSPWAGRELIKANIEVYESKKLKINGILKIFAKKAVWKGFLMSWEFVPPENLSERLFSETNRQKTKEEEGFSSWGSVAVSWEFVPNELGICHPKLGCCRAGLGICLS